ncbi:MAG TPA: putative toxin-antitoxin system toxin component, PIN family [Anaerolineae bacterium]
MRLVLDTNVLISALLSSSGPPAEIIRRWEAEEFDVATSAELIVELRRALNYPKVMKYLKLPSAALESWLKRFALIAVVVEPAEKIKVIRADHADNRVLECAIAAGAAFIVTGDEHLIALKEYKGVTITNPAGFIKWLAAHEGGGATANDS